MARKLKPASKLPSFANDDEAAEGADSHDTGEIREQSRPAAQILTHEALWLIVRQGEADYEPWGKTARDDSPGDCSAGCRHYIPLRGALGNDWGVCTNARSHRAGLLTFEHQGCMQFEPESEDS